MGGFIEPVLAVKVSTHSRPKAAGERAVFLFDLNQGFNTQPPEGGWLAGFFNARKGSFVSTHSRPKAAG